MDNLKKPKTKKVWVKKSEIQDKNLKCLVIHTARCAEKTYRWYLDNGCSCHRTGDRSLFSHYKDKVEGSVTFGDGNAALMLVEELLKQLDYLSFPMYFMCEV